MLFFEKNTSVGVCKSFSNRKKREIAGFQKCMSHCYSGKKTKRKKVRSPFCRAVNGTEKFMNSPRMAQLVHLKGGQFRALF